MGEELNYLVFYRILASWKKQLLVILGTTAIISSLVMLSKPNLYKASTIFYPASISIQKPVFTEAERNINYYGDDHDVDRILSIANSMDTKTEIINDLQLRQSYGLKETSRSVEKLYQQFNKSYTAIKTKYDAIIISFEDKNPELAADVANYARSIVDKKTQEIVKNAQNDVLKNAETALNIIEEQILELNKKLTIERKKYGVYDTQSQSEAFAILESRGTNMTDLRKRIKDYTEGLSVVKSLEDQLLFASEEQVKYKSNVYRLRSAIQSKITSIHLIQRAQKPIKKSGPIRSLYVLGSLLLMTFVSIASILFLEKIEVDKKE